MIEIQHVQKIYQTGKVFVQALSDVSLTIKEGDFLIVRGSSGSGKSTLLNIIGLLDEPTNGKVFFHGQEVSYRDFDSLAVLRSKTVSFIFQSFNLNPVLTLEENVMVPLMIRNDISRKEKIARVGEWIEKTGLSSHRFHKPDELSGGQRQRVAIARAMVTHPQLVIADEPTANLDSKTTQSILEFMKQLNEEKKTAFIFATHDPILATYGKITWFIRDGKVSLTEGEV